MVIGSSLFDAASDPPPLLLAEPQPAASPAVIVTQSAADNILFFIDLNFIRKFLLLFLTIFCRFRRFSFSLFHLEAVPDRDISHHGFSGLNSA
jgi:hypothetical protein